MSDRSEMMRHIPELDGVRGIAVLMVMVMHFYDPVEAFSPFGPLTHVLQQGGAGVDIFFVLSGFLITSILVASKQASNYFRAFYARRALRIFPLYFAVVAFFFFFAVPLAQRHGKDLWIRPEEQIWYWLFLANWRHAFQFNDGAQLAHFWSLAIEEQFYLIWSVVVWFSRVSWLRVLCLAIVVAVPLGRILAADQGVSAAFLRFNTFSHLDALTLGALLAISASARGFFARYAVVILPLSALLNLVPLPWNLAWALPAMGSASLVALAATRPVPLLRLPWLRSFGKYSYGLYVLHYLLHGVFVLGVGKIKPFPFAIASIVGGIAASFALAWLSWNLLEAPFLKLKKYFKYRFAEAIPQTAPIEAGL